MGIMGLGSLARFSREAVEFVVHNDGTLTEEDREELSAKLAVRTFYERAEADARWDVHLARYPACRAFRAESIYGLKLFDAPLAANGESFAFCDSDILFLRPFHNLFAWPDRRTGCVFMHDFQDAYALRPWHLLGQGIAVPRKLNCGLFMIRKDHYDLDFIEWLLARRYAVFGQLPWVEQTCWGALAWRSAGRFWVERQLRTVQGGECLSDGLVAGHFTSTVRGLMSRALAKQQASLPSECVLTESMRRLNPLHILNQQSRRFLKRQRLRSFEDSFA